MAAQKRKRSSRKRWRIRKRRNPLVDFDTSQESDSQQTTGIDLGLIFMVMIAGGVILLIGGILISTWPNKDQKDSPSSEKKRTSLIPEKNFMEKASADEIALAVEKSVKGFMNSKDHIERCRYVIDGNKLQDKMREFYARPGASKLPTGFGKIAKLEPAAFGGTPIMIAAATDGVGRSAWLFNLLPTQDTMKIDWEASVGYGEMSWAQFLTDRPNSTLQMRVYLKRVPPVTSSGFSGKQFEAFEISTRSQSHKIITHVKRDLPLASQLSKAVPFGALQPVNLRLRWQENDPHKKALHIEELIHNFWIDPKRLHSAF